MTLLLLLTACTGKEPQKTDDSGTVPGDDTGTVPLETACDEASAMLGYRACVHSVPDEDTFSGITIASSSADQLRVGKYLVPAIEDTPVPPAFLDVNAFQLHYDFLVTAFPDAYAGLDTATYQDLILYPDTRQYYAGTISLYIDGDGFYYGFTVWDDPLDSTSTVTAEDVEAAWTELQSRFLIGDLAWVPNSSNQQDAALEWDDTPFEIKNPAEVDYEVYNPGPAYGYLRLYTADEFADAQTEATFGYQDIVVIEEAPEDIERVTSGIVTGTRQGDLSHLNVRSTARGTPNCYIRDPLEALADYQDQLVHFECGKADYTVETTTIEDAQAWWDSIRPDPVDICEPDLGVTWMAPLLDLPTATYDERHDNVCTYGAKGSNLATLYQLIPAEYQLDGFLIPFSYYQDFVENHGWTVDLGSGPGTYTFQETLDAWLADDSFLTDATVRAERLEDLTYAMEHQSALDEDVRDAVIAEIRTAWDGDDYQMIRFRSSSNAEDGIDFSGAGLYLSESGCIADELDGDTVGPSACDPDKPDEQTITHALLEVWSSTWGMVAYDERDWYGIDHSIVAMGVLVDDRTNNEQANIVAFSGNPTSYGDERYLVNAQCCELEVVAAEAGIYPEKTLLTVGDEGEVTKIDRVSESSETAEVLSDEQLDEIGWLLWDIVQLYPLDYEVTEGHDVVWDTEMKVLDDGQLIIKQIRPFQR